MCVCVYVPCSKMQLLSLVSETFFLRCPCPAGAKGLSRSSSPVALIYRHCLSGRCAPALKSGLVGCGLSNPRECVGMEGAQHAQHCGGRRLLLSPSVSVFTLEQKCTPSARSSRETGEGSRLLEAAF